MKEVLIDARAAGERLIKDLLKISAKLDKNDVKTQSEVYLVLNLQYIVVFSFSNGCFD